jgi:hypothetical protein
MLSIRQAGVHRFEVNVLNSETDTKKKAAARYGSYVYLAVTEVGHTPQHVDEYRQPDFSSNCHHVIEFPLEQLAKQPPPLCPVYGKESTEELTETATGAPARKRLLFDPLASLTSRSDLCPAEESPKSPVNKVQILPAVSRVQGFPVRSAGDSCSDR